MLSILDISSPIGFSISLTILMPLESQRLLNCKDNHVLYHIGFKRDSSVANSLHLEYEEPMLSTRGYQFQWLVSWHIPDHR